MRVSTTQFYDRASASMSGLSARADELMNQISSTRKLAAPSSDSAAYQRLRTLARDASDDEAYGANLGLAAGALKQADTTLEGVEEQFRRARELTVLARNGVQTDETRKMIAAEVDQLLDGMVALANAKDERGQHLFGGMDGGPAVTLVDGAYSLATTTGAAIPIGAGRSVQPGEPAVRVFQAGAGDAFRLLADLSAALKAGGDVTDATGDALDGLEAASEQVSIVRSSLGARAAGVELEQARLVDVGLDREESRSRLEDTDIPATVLELQKTMTILNATHASFSKLQSLSLFDYLR